MHTANASKFFKVENGTRVICDAFKGTPEDKANARLISAAPELLAFAAWALNQFQGDSGTGHSHWEQFPEYCAGLVAITKATGVQP